MIIDEKKITESAERKTAADIAVETIIWFATELIRRIEDGSVSTSEDIVGLTDETIEKVKGISTNTCEETEK